jgi:hypothetical protein
MKKNYMRIVLIYWFDLAHGPRNKPCWRRVPPGSYLRDTHSDKARA